MGSITARHACFILVAVVVAATVASCIKFPEQYSAVPPGTWRGTLQLAGSLPGSDPAFDEQTGGNLPFTFEVEYVTEDSFHLTIINGEQTVTLTDMTYGHRIRDGRDTLQANFPNHASYIKANYEEDAIEGYWYDPTRRGDYQIRFKALHGKSGRFEMLRVDPKENLTGTWRFVFDVDTSQPYLARATFHQDTTFAECRIETARGEQMYLVGGVENDRVFASFFDGKDAYLLEAKILDDGTLPGIFRSGSHYKTYFSATRDADFELSQPDSTGSER